MRNRDLRESTTTTSAATTNYDLPQWNGEDVTSWMTNLNDAFNKIDSAMWANHTAMAGYDKIASDLQKLADGIKVDNAEIREALRIVQQGMADQLTQLNQAKTDITNANLAISQLQTEDNALSAMIEDLQDDVGILPTFIVVDNEDNSPLFTFEGEGALKIHVLSVSVTHTRVAGIVYRTEGTVALPANAYYYTTIIPDNIVQRINDALGKASVIYTNGVEYSEILQIYVNTGDSKIASCALQHLRPADSESTSVAYGVAFVA